MPGRGTVIAPHRKQPGPDRIYTLAPKGMIEIIQHTLGVGWEAHSDACVDAVKSCPDGKEVTPPVLTDHVRMKMARSVLKELDEAMVKAVTDRVSATIVGLNGEPLVQ